MEKNAATGLAALIIRNSGLLEDPYTIIYRKRYIPIYPNTIIRFSGLLWRERI